MTSGHQPLRRLRGEPLRALLRDQIRQHRGGLHAALALFDAKSAVAGWIETLRAVEEFINLPLFGLGDDALEAALLALPVDAAISQPRRLHATRHQIAYRYGDAFAARFTTLLLQGSAIGRAFALKGIDEAAAGFATVGTMIGYLQSRRRHLVSLLYTLPLACVGTRPVTPIDTINQFLPLVELNGVALTGLYQQLVLADVFPDYSVDASEHGFAGSHVYPALDTSFLEPERASIVEMHTATSSSLALDALESIRRDRLFSAAELRNDILLMEAAYAEFDLAGSAFAPAAAFVRDVSMIARDDYWVSLDPNCFTQLANAAGMPLNLRKALIHACGDYVANTNSYAPFIAIGDELRTSVTLLSRFLYYWKNVCLYRSRRFQIRSGFIFEQTVAAALERQGFAITGIKRLNRKEFDVVATRDGVIFNVQCKNNFIDLSRLEADVHLFARYNRARVAAYERALRKEAGREALLTARLGITRVEHLVVTRFPIATDNPRIVPFSRVDDLSELASLLTAGAGNSTPSF